VDPEPDDPPEPELEPELLPLPLLSEPDAPPADEDAVLPPIEAPPGALSSSSLSQLLPFSRAAGEPEPEPLGCWDSGGGCCDSAGLAASSSSCRTLIRLRLIDLEGLPGNLERPIIVVRLRLPLHLHLPAFLIGFPLFLLLFDLSWDFFDFFDLFDFLDLWISHCG